MRVRYSARDVSVVLCGTKWTYRRRGVRYVPPAETIPRVPVCSKTSVSWWDANEHTQTWERVRSDDAPFIHDREDFLTRRCEITKETRLFCSVNVLLSLIVPADSCTSLLFTRGRKETIRPCFHARSSLPPSISPCCNNRLAMRL